MKQPEDFTPDSELWNADSRLQSDRPGVYVAISGNTGAGKSSLIRAINRQAHEQGQRFVCISERALHHPYLPLMFAKPETFAFPIQLNFMLQRHLVLLRQLGLGNTVVVERSHFDDDMFVREHVSQGKISAEQYEAYKVLAQVLHARTPAPGILVLLDVNPGVSIDRLALSESTGERPKEFPTEKAKEDWVHRWHHLYSELHKGFRQNQETNTRLKQTIILERDAELETEVLAREVFRAIMERRKALGAGT